MRYQLGTVWLHKGNVLYDNIILSGKPTVYAKDLVPYSVVVRAIYNVMTKPILMDTPGDHESKIRIVEFCIVRECFKKDSHKVVGNLGKIIDIVYKGLSKDIAFIGYDYMWESGREKLSIYKPK